MVQVRHLGRTIRFLRHVRPRAVAGRIAHGLDQKLVGRVPALIKPRPLGPNPFGAAHLGAFAKVWRVTSKRFADIDGLERGTFAVKGARVDFGSIEAMDWSPRFKDEPHLSNWAYDFGFFHFAVVLIDRDPAHGLSVLARMLRTMETRHAIGGGKVHFAWDPIVVAVRILCLSAAGRLAREAGVDPRDPDLLALAQHVAYATAFLHRFAERYLGYNHTLFALVALVAGQVAVHDGHQAAALSAEAIDSLASQLLPDGLQGERTATYHIHVLLLARALRTLGAVPTNKCDWLDKTIEQMTIATDVLTHPDGEIALFNDCAMADSVPPADVGWAPRASASYRQTLPSAGYTKLASGGMVAIFDTGKLGPNDVIGHAHADFLSFELSVGGARLVTDPGVFAYSQGPLRDTTRSAASHNGPTYAGLEPAEFFGAWRVGWRGAAFAFADDQLPGRYALEAAGWCNGYDRYGGRTFRYLGLDDDGTLVVIDLWRAGATLAPAIRLLVPDAWTVSRDDGARVRFSHRNGAAASLVSSHFQTADPSPAEWRPKGAMVKALATELVFAPTAAAADGLHVNAIVISGQRQAELPTDLEALVERFSRSAGAVADQAR